MTIPTVMLGYYENKAETKQTIIENGDGIIWVHTQDIGYMTEDDVLFVTDRMKRMITRHDGFKVYPSIIESAISRHEAVAACTVVGVQNSGDSQSMLPKAFVVLKREYVEHEGEIATALEAHCRKELA